MILARQDDFYYNGFADWCVTHDEILPRRDGSTSEERSLASWFRHKLRLYYSDDLSNEELVKLKKIPAINEHICLHGQWSLKFALKSMNFEDWCAKHRRVLPVGGTGEESSLEDWPSNTISHYHSGRNGKHSENRLPYLWKIPVAVDLEVFRTKNHSLSRSERFDLKCKNFEKWCSQHSGSLPKQKGDTQEERTLGTWLMNKLFRYRRGKLSDDQIAQLKKIPAISEVFSVQGKSFQSRHFPLKCKSFEDWCAQHGGSLPKQKGDTQKERSLAIWLTKQLSNHRHGKLSCDQQAQLRKIPAISQFFSVQGNSFQAEHFALKCKSFEDWCAQHGGSLPKQNGDTQEERSLAIWLMNKLFRYRRGKLSVDEQTKLTEIGAISELFSDQSKSFRSEHFAMKCKNFQDWCAQHGGSLPKQNGDTQEERSLAIWLTKQLSSYRRGKLCNDQLAQLRKIPAISEVLSVQGKSFRSLHFAQKCKSFEDWCARHGGSLPKQNGDTQEERSLAIWLMNKLSSYRRGKLSVDQQTKLTEIGAISELFSDQSKSFRSEHFAMKCKNFQDWCAQHGGSLPKQNGYTQEERTLGIWFKDKLFRYRRGKLSVDQQTKLREIPAISNFFCVQRSCLSHSKRFDLKCKSFEKWLVAQNGTLPKQGGKSEEERSLANWLKEKLSIYRRGKLSDDQLSKLRKVRAISYMFGVQCPNRSELFNLRCKIFGDWCAAHNETLPKRNGDTQEERSLANWFKAKLHRRRHGKLSNDQLAKLREIPAVSEVFGVQGK